MNRGDFVTVAMPGDFGKPRPALVIQSDLFLAHGTVTVQPDGTYTYVPDPWYARAGTTDTFGAISAPPSAISTQPPVHCQLLC